MRADGLETGDEHQHLAGDQRGGSAVPPPRIGSAAAVSHHFPLLGKINYQEPRRQGEASGKKLKRGCRRRLPSGENRLRLHISSVAW